MFKLDDENKKLLRVVSSGRCALDRVHKHLKDDEVRSKKVFGSTWDFDLFFWILSPFILTCVMHFLGLWRHSTTNQAVYDECLLLSWGM